MKAISVIIPTYKPEEYIYECLQSLEQQSLEQQKFEIIIVLNGEKEPFFSELEQYIENKNNYQLLYSEQSGVSNARNLGMKNSNYEYIIFLDDDDYLTDNYLENMLALARPNKVVVSNLLCFEDNDIKEISKDYVSKQFETFYIHNNNYKVTSNLFKMRKFFSNACGKLICKQDIENILFDNNFSKGEDSLFMSMISKNIKNIIFTDADVIYYRRIRNNSASRSKENTPTILKKRNLLILKYLEIMINQRKNYLFHSSRIFAQVIGVYKEVLK